MQPSPRPIRRLPLLLLIAGAALPWGAGGCGGGESDGGSDGAAASARDPEAAEAALTRGRTFVRQRRLADAEAAFLEAVLHDPENPNGHYLLGKNRFERNRPAPGAPVDPVVLDQARQSIERALELDASQPRYHHYLGLVRAAAGDYAAATGAFRETLRLRPDHLEARVSLGTALAYEGQLLPARDELLTAIGQDPSNVVPHHELGGVYLRLEDWEAARGAFEAALGIERESRASWQGLITALTELGDEAALAQARGELERLEARRDREAGIARLDGDRAAAEPELAATFDRALTLLRAGQRPAAIAGFQDVLATWPDTVPAHVNLGLLYLVDARPEDAIAELEKAVAVAPDDALAWYQLGRVRAAMRNDEPAKEALLRSLGLDPDNDGVRLELARVHARNAEPELAAARLEEILARNPTNALARDFLDSLGARPGGGAPGAGIPGAGASGAGN